MIALAAMLGLLIVLVGALPWLAEPALRGGLRLASFDNVDFKRLRLGWEGLEVEEFTLGEGDQKLERLRIVWRPADLLDGRIERIAIEGLVARAAWRDGRLEFTGIDTADETSEAGAMPLLSLLARVEQIDLDDARLELATGLGLLELPVSAQIRPVGERVAFDATIQDARFAGGEGTIRADGIIEGSLPRDGPITIRTARAQGRLSLMVDDAALGTIEAIDGDATLAFDLAERRLQLATSGLAFEGAEPLSWDAQLGSTQIELAADEGLESGTLDLALSEATWTAPEVAVTGVSLRQPLDWTFAEETLRLTVGDPGTLAAESVTGPEFSAGPLVFSVGSGGRPLTEIAFENGTPATWHQSVALVVEALEARLATLPLRSESGTIALAIEGNRAGPNRADVSLTGGALRLPEYALALDGITLNAALTAEGLASNRSIPIAVERISHGGKPAWFTPLTFEGELHADASGSELERMAFEGTIRRIGGGLTVTIHGEVRPEDAVHMEIDVPPVSFGPDLQPQDLAPTLGGLLDDVVGSLALDGDLSWSDAGLGGDMSLLIDQLGSTVGPGRLEQINGVIRFDQLWPPITPPGQQLAIGLLDLGLPFTGGIMTFQLLPGPRIEVAELDWRLAGGTVRAEPFSLGSPLEGLNVTLRAQQIQLGQLLARTKLDGLTGEGSLDGVLPVRLSEGAAVVEGGELAATGPGVLRYATEAAPEALQSGGEGIDLLLQALENFRYEELRITLEGRTDAAMDIGLHLRGANPDLYDGHPIEFNLDLEGELANILRQGVASYRIPDRIRERMQGFGR